MSAVIPLSKYTLEKPYPIGGEPFARRRKGGLWSAASKFTSRAVIILLTGAALIDLPSNSTVSARNEFNFALPHYSADEYMLAAQDKIRVRVHEWRVGGYQEWQALSGDFTINDIGAISLPLIGRINARALTTAELAEAISQRLQVRAGLKVPPETSVEIVSFGPVYIVGQVQNPGEFAFRPGMTMIKALAVAGGVYRGEGGDQARQRVQSIGRLEQAELELRRMYARRARLLAEKAAIESGGEAHIQPPTEVGSTSDVDRLLQEEERVMQARMAALRSKETKLRELIDLYAKGEQTLIAKIKNHAEQLRLAVAGADDAEKLFAKKLIATTRRMNAQNLVTQLEATRLDYDTSLLKVRQELNRANRDLTDMHAEMTAQVTTELQGVESSIELLASKSNAEKSLLGLSESVALNIGSSEASTIKLAFTIKRGHAADNSLNTFSADGDTAVKPGDVIMVSLARPQEAGAVDGDSLPPAPQSKVKVAPPLDPYQEPAALNHWTN